MAKEDKSVSVFEKPPLWIGVNVFLAAIVAGALVLSGVVGYRLWRANEADGAGQDAVNEARQLVTNFMTTSFQSIDADFARIREGSTGDFAEQWKKGEPALRETIAANQSVSVGSVLSAALVHGDPNYQTDADSAGVLVVADANVTNVNAPQGALTHYRVLVELSLDKGKGKWLIGKLEFVG